MKRRILSIITALALCLGLLPGTAGAADAEDEASAQPRASAADINMNSHGFVFAQGVPIVIKQNGEITSIYDTDDNLLSGDTDLSSFRIYGGWFDKDNTHTASTSIVMESGTVMEIYGGSFSGTLEGNTNIVLNGGKVGWVFGGGSQSTVTGTTHVTVNSGAKVWGQKISNDTAERGCVYGGGYAGTVSSTEVVFNGGDAAYIYGGGNGDCTCTNTRVKFMGQPDDFVVVSGGGFGGSVTNVVLEFHGNGSSLTNTGIAVYGGGYGDSVENVQIIVGENSDPSSTVFYAQWPGSSSTVGSVSFDVSWNPERPSMMNSSKLSGTGVTGKASASLQSDRSRDDFVYTELEDIDELILEGIHFRANPANGFNLDRLEIDASATIAVPAKQNATLAVNELAGSGYIYFEKSNSGNDSITPITVNQISVPSGARIKVGRLGGLPDSTWEGASLFEGAGVQALTSLDCFVSIVEGYDLVIEGNTVKVHANSGLSQAYLDPVPKFDREDRIYRYGETIQVIMGLKSAGQPLPGQVLSVEGGASGHQSFATGTTDANGMVTISVPVNDAVWNNSSRTLGGYFAGTEQYKENSYAVSNSDGNINYTIQPAQVTLSGEIAAPVRDGVPVETLSTGENAVCTAEVIWSPADTAFRPDVAYTASIRLIPKPGYSLDGGRLDSVTYQGQALTLPGSIEPDGSMVISNVENFAPIPAIHVTGVTLDQSSLSPIVGETNQLNAVITPSDADNKAVAWTSSDPAVATVDTTGKVTATGIGTAIITVTTADGNKTASCAVTVTGAVIPVTGVSLNKTTLSLLMGASERLTATVSPSNATDKAVSWTSSNPSIAAVDDNGNVTAVGAGNAVITVTTADGTWSESCTVTVRAAVILPDPPTGDNGEQLRLVMEDGISKVPAGLLGIEALDTPAKLESVLRTAITQTDSGIPLTNTAVYDVELQISTDGGATWTKATAGNFPANGLTVTLPYPAGTNSNYTFTVVHMFTTSDFGKTPGDTETPSVANIANGLRFTVTGLSPISVGWVQPSTPVTPITPSTPSDSGGRRSSRSSANTYAVTVEKSEHGKVTSSRTNAGSGSTVTLTVVPDSGYVLDTLTVTDSRDREISLTAQDDGKYVFTMPDRDVTVNANFAPLTDENMEKFCDGGADCPSRNFTDLGTVGTWYHEAVDYALRNGMMSGYNSTSFGPDNNLSRAMLAQILYNAAGKPPVTGDNIFADVDAGQWYAPAVAWAVSEGIVGGYSNGLFGPDDGITREQLASMLWRYAGSPAMTDKDLRFTDADKIGDWALDALRWATENGILSGYGNGSLEPQGLATRAQVAQMLKNFFGNR